MANIGDFEGIAFGVYVRLLSGPPVFNAVLACSVRLSSSLDSGVASPSSPTTCIKRQ